MVCSKKKKKAKMDCTIREKNASPTKKQKWLATGKMQISG